MGDPYVNRFEVASAQDAKFVGNVLESLDFEQSDIEISLDIKSAEAIQISDVLAIADADAGHSETIESAIEDSTDEDESEATTDTGESETTTDEDIEVPTFLSNSSTPTVLATIDATSAEWMKTSAIREAIPEENDINMDNLSGLLWSIADDGHLEKRKDGHYNEYRVSELGRRGLEAFEGELAI